MLGSRNLQSHIELFRCSVRRLAREASAQLEQLDATGIFGLKRGFRTRWDEYCHEIQEGPLGAPGLDCAKTVGPIVLAIVRAIDNSEATLFAIGARSHLNENEKADQDVVGVPDLIQRCLEEAIETLASCQNLTPRRKLKRGQSELKMSCC